MVRGARRAFARVELAVVAAICGIGAAVLIVAGAGERREARLGSDLSNLAKIAGLTGSFAADNEDRFWSFSWRRTGPTNPGNPSQYPDLRTASDDVNAGACQAVDILRRHGREDMPRIDGWLPHVFYSHLPLLDYAGGSFPDLTFVSSGDAARGQWARDPLGFDQGRFLPVQPAPGSTNKRWPYSASFNLPPAIYDQSGTGNRLNQEGNPHNLYWIPGAVMIGGLRTSDVAFPAEKVHLHDLASWHFARRAAYCGADPARTVMLLADGSAGVRAATDANPGWKPNAPWDPSPTRMTYEPAAWEPPPSTGVFGEPIIGRFRWTREGIAGRDFGGPEVGP